MKTRHKYSLALNIFVLLFLFSVSIARATVGGPTYVGYLNYNPTDESVYYIEQSSSGRGCPPELKKISLTTEKIETVFSCNQGENLRGDDYSDGHLVTTEILKITEGFKTLTPISLPKNDIRIDAEFIKSEKLDPQSDWAFRSQFTMHVYQGTHLIDDFSITGCSTEQPFTFAGYTIPGFEKKIVLLSSTKSDCFEGGYTGERVHVVGGITALDTTQVSNEFKSANFPLIPNESTLVVFEKDTAQPLPPTPTLTMLTMLTALIALVVLGVGLLIGILIGKNSYTPFRKVDNS